jgi:hypothetical protein
MTETALDQHMALVGRVIAKFVSDGLMLHDIDSRGAEKFLGTQEDSKVLAAVLTWMLDEGIIRAKKVTPMISGGVIHFSGAQLTAKGLAIVRQPVPGGETIEKRIQTAGSRDWGGIGELIGGIAGGFTKSMGSG